MKIEAVNHIVRYSLRLLLCDFGCHDRSIFVELFGVRADDFAFECLCEFYAEFGFADGRCAYDEYPQHVVSTVLVIHNYKRKLI